MANESLMNFLKSNATDEGSVQILGAGEAYDPDSVVSTGSLSFDYLIGRGGIKFGTVAHIYGPEASGKTTSILNMIASIHRTKSGDDSNVVFFDAENALSPEWMQKIGVDLDRCPIFYPDDQEHFINLTKGILQSVIDKTLPHVPMIVLDSVAALKSSEVVNLDAKDFASRASEARKWSEHMPTIQKLARQANTIVVLINQARDKQDQYSAGEFTYPGGRALKHAAGLNVLCKAKGAEIEKDSSTAEKIVHAMEGKIEKNKTSGSLGKFISRWAIDRPVSSGWGLFDTWALMERRDNARKRRLDFDADHFVSITDRVPYAKDTSWDSKTNEEKSSKNYWCIFLWEDILKAIREDDPDFDDKNLGGKTFRSKSAFVEFVDKHPSLGALMEAYVLETLNLDLTDEEVAEVAQSVDETVDEDEGVDEDVDAEDSADDADESEADDEYDDEYEEELEDDE